MSPDAKRKGSVPADRPTTAGRTLGGCPTDFGSDHEKREAFVRLRDRYEEARELASSREPHENLEWILGARRNTVQDPLGLQAKTIALIALWLQDLSLELDRRLEEPATGDAGEGALSAAARQSGAERLRDATERFLAAFLPPAPA